ncbi:hypothetical protein [Polyangium sp. 15x6]|uniref:hypothetical protein n=1 Tax=Polyangium sp. 15x6 TaxID=3042687 RepID=UPI00249A990A|nr:hypothetical protein [Polyangium sp. 15x6]MDI3290751.1 hypothetical protein [Polyangium sp. 15x6]
MFGFFYCALLCASVLLATPGRARAFELSGGVSLGGILVGTDPRLAVSPHARMSWRMKGSILLAVDEMCSILPSTNELGAGVYNHTSVAVGYASQQGNFSLGPSLSLYTMPACGVTLCGRVAGVAPGARAQADVSFVGPRGVSVSAAVDWVGGRSLVLPGGIAAMVVAGPVLRWGAK